MPLCLMPYSLAHIDTLPLHMVVVLTSALLWYPSFLPHSISDLIRLEKLKHGDCKCGSLNGFLPISQRSTLEKSSIPRTYPAKCPSRSRGDSRLYPWSESADVWNFRMFRELLYFWQWKWYQLEYKEYSACFLIVLSNGSAWRHKKTNQLKCVFHASAITKYDHVLQLIWQRLHISKLWSDLCDAMWRYRSLQESTRPTVATSCYRQT